MNSNTYASLTDEDIAAFKNHLVKIDESIPDGVIVTDGVPYPAGEAVQRAKSAAERAYYGENKTRSGYTKPGQQTRDKAKAKASRQARKRNRAK